MVGGSPCCQARSKARSNASSRSLSWLVVTPADSLSWDMVLAPTGEVVRVRNRARDGRAHLRAFGPRPDLLGLTRDGLGASRTRRTVRSNVPAGEAGSQEKGSRPSWP